MAKYTETLTTRKILVVDDEPNMRRTLCDVLIAEGHDVTCASTGEAALDLCRRESFKVVLMDVRMPGINGVEAFRLIRRHQEGVRVILMSAYGIESLREAALDEGAVACLPKPLDLDQVIDLVNEVRDTAILVVEPETDTARSLQQGLKDRGYRVTVTDTPHSALELVEQIRFDLIFLDTKLSAMTGLELYLAIKRVTPGAVAIMISGREAEFLGIAREAVRRCAYTVIRKPLDIDHILGLLDQIMGRRLSGDLRKPECTPDERDGPP